MYACSAMRQQLIVSFPCTLQAIYFQVPTAIVESSDTNVSDRKIPPSSMVRLFIRQTNTPIVLIRRQRSTRSIVIQEYTPPTVVNELSCLRSLLGVIGTPTPIRSVSDNRSPRPFACSIDDGCSNRGSNQVSKLAVWTWQFIFGASNLVTSGVSFRNESQPARHMAVHARNAV